MSSPPRATSPVHFPHFPTGAGDFSGQRQNQVTIVHSIREYQNSYLLFTKVSMHLSISHSLCSAVHNYDSLCRRSSRSPIMLSILLVGRAGASPPSLTAAYFSIYLFIYLFIYIFIYIRVVRRALNLLRASFSPIFQYFIFPNL